METDSRFPTGPWHGFYLEDHQPRRGWMHLYLSFENGTIKGEGTDYVGPWHAVGNYDQHTGVCQWAKQYLGKHKVQYQGIASKNGIQGQWKISFFSSEFHIWPQKMGHLDELYLQEDLSQPVPSVQLGSVENEPFFV